MLKVLYLPLGNQPGTIDGFKNAGVNLQVYDFWGRWEQTKNNTLVSNEFLTHVRQFQPNLIHMQLQFTGVIPPAVINEARAACPGVVISNWSGDCRAKAMPEFTSI